MSTCCRKGTGVTGVSRIAGMAGYAVPGTVLVLLPKCPLCIAAWLAAGTGIGVAVSTAAHLRTLLLLACFACVGSLAARHVFRLMAALFSAEGGGAAGLRTPAGNP